MLGARDWNVLSARIQSEPQGESPALPVVPRISLPVVPLRDIVLFPNLIAPIFVGRAKTQAAIEHAMRSDSPILGVTQRHSGDDTIAGDGLYGVGVKAKVLDLTTFGDATTRCFIKCQERAAITQFTDGAFLSAEVTPVTETRSIDQKAFALAGEVLKMLESYLNISLDSPPAPYARLPHIREPGAFADTAATFLSIDIAKRQDLLETTDVIERLEKILAVVTKGREAAA